MGRFAKKSSFLRYELHSNSSMLITEKKVLSWGWREHASPLSTEPVSPSKQILKF